MQHMQKLVKVQEIQATMMELSKEMMKVIVQLVSQKFSCDCEKDYNLNNTKIKKEIKQT